MNIEMTKEMLQAQIVLNDAAVKALGLQGAEAAVVLSKMYQTAINTTETTPTQAPVNEDK